MNTIYTLIKTPFLDDDNINESCVDYSASIRNNFDNVIDKLKNINNKITLNKELINSDFCDGICKKYDIKKINMGDINESTKIFFEKKIFT